MAFYDLAVECANAQQERGKNPKSREKKLLTAQRSRTYTHPTRPIKLGAAACIPTTRPHRAGPSGLRCALTSCPPGE
jgi:hypothetical protein